MADNVTLNAGSGGADLATDDIAGVHYQIAKLAHGALDSATIVSTASGLPVQQQGTFTVDLGTTDNAVLDAIEADTTTLAGAIDGTEMQVDVVGSLPAGTNNIGDVDVLSFPTSVHAEDFDTGAGTDNTLAFGIAVPASGGAVVVPGDATAGLKVNLGADNDVTVTGTVTANAGTNLNTSALALESGGNLASVASSASTLAGAVSGSEMQVDVVSSALPTGAATAANQSTIIGHVDGIEGLLTTIDADTGTIAAAVATEGSALGSGILLQGDDGTDRTNVLVDTDGHLQVDVLSGGGGGTEYNEDAATPATITGTATMMERDDTLSTVTPVEGDWVSMRATAEGALWVQDFNSDAILADTANIDTNMATVAGAVSGTEMQVDVVTSALPSGAATAANQSTANTSLSNIQTAVQLIDNASVNHDAAVVAGVSQIGLDARSTDPSAVASGDAVRAMATLLGKQVVYPYAHPGRTWQYAGPTGGITDTADDAIQAAGGAGVRHYLTSLTVVNAHSTVATEVVIKDGSTVIHRGYAAAAGGGYTITFPTPLRGTAATALNVACITTGSATHVSASGFSAAE